jgi:N-acetylneuraminic acid mutarotase
MPRLDRVVRGKWVVATFGFVLACGSSDPKPGNPPGGGSGGGGAGMGGGVGGSGGTGGMAPGGSGGGAGRGGTGGATGGTGGSGGGGAGTGGGGAGGMGGTAGAGGGGAGGAAGRDGGAPPPDGGMAGRAGGAGGAAGMGGAGGAAGTPGTNPAPNDYATRAVLMERNSEFAMAALDGKVYVMGGYPSSPSATRPTLQIYDPATNMWKIGRPAPTPLHHPVLAGVNGKLYSLGGQTANGNSDLTLIYDPTTDNWTEGERMMTQRGGGAAAIIGTKIYVVGARPAVADAAMNAFEVYDTATDNWAALPKLPTDVNGRNHLAAGAMGGKIYVAGGRFNGGGFASPMTNRLDMFDPATMTWTQKKVMLRPRGGVYGVVAYGCFYIMGGEGSNIGEPNDVFPDNDVYNPVNDTWTALKKLPIPFHGVTGGAFVDGIIYMPGGGTMSGGSSGTTMHQVFRPTMRCE